MGLAVHRSVLAAGDAESGVSMHWVTPELDAGPILVRIPIRPPFHGCYPAEDQQRTTQIFNLFYILGVVQLIECELLCQVASNEACMPD